MDNPRRSRLTEADHAAWASYASRITPLPGRKRPVLTEPPMSADSPPSGRQPVRRRSDRDLARMCVARTLCQPR